MSLNWDARKCGDAWDALDPNHKESLIFSTMSVGIGVITEENHLEWYGRYLQTYHAYGWGDPYLSLADVKAAIGLSTNVFPKETQAAFRKKLVRIIEEKTAEKVRQAVKELEATDA
jgi:hypothetical protein